MTARDSYPGAGGLSRALPWLQLLLALVGGAAGAYGAVSMRLGSLERAQVRTETQVAAMATQVASLVSTAPAAIAARARLEERVLQLERWRDRADSPGRGRRRR